MAMPPEQILHHAFLHLMEKNKISPQAGLTAALSVAANIGIDMCSHNDETLVTMFREWVGKVRAAQKIPGGLH
jgi:hypothetical protein